ncbi:MAG: RHS repeat protein, partial [Armatimonadetes bacterium]|nr:RHS repeat protein [Armatimonadota bacterium]
MEIDPNTGDVTLVEGDGQRKFFVHNVDDTYTREPGVFDALVRNSDGSYTVARKSQTQLNFTAAGVLATVVDPNGNTVTLSYDQGGRLTTIAAPDGRSLSLAYNGENRVATVTDPLNRTTTLSYTGALLTTVTDPLNQSLSFGYAAGDRIAALTDKRGNTWSFSSFA